jgi:hypothetical protein
MQGNDFSSGIGLGLFVVLRACKYRKNATRLTNSVKVESGRDPATNTVFSSSN